MLVSGLDPKAIPQPFAVFPGNHGKSRWFHWRLSTDPTKPDVFRRTQQGWRL